MNGDCVEFVCRVGYSASAVTCFVSWYASLCYILPFFVLLIPQDYYEMNITARYDDPNMLKLQQIEDPYFYAHRLTMPKLIING